MRDLHIAQHIAEGRWAARALAVALPVLPLLATTPRGLTVCADAPRTGWTGNPFFAFVRTANECAAGYVVTPALSAEEPQPQATSPRKSATAQRLAKRSASRRIRTEPPPPEGARPGAMPASRSTEPRQLRTPQMGDEAEAALRIRATLQRASSALDHVLYGALNPDGRAQYDTAERFVQRADAALNVKNFVFATCLADKAETLARELSRRR